MTNWNVSEEAAALHRDAIVWDMLIPLGGHSHQRFERMLAEAKNGGYTYITFTIATDWGTLNQSIHRIAEKRAYFLARPEDYVFVETVDDVLRAKKEGKLAVSLHFSGHKLARRRHQYDRDLLQARNSSHADGLQH